MIEEEKELRTFRGRAKKLLALFLAASCSVACSALPNSACAADEKNSMTVKYKGQGVYTVTAPAGTNDADYSFYAADYNKNRNLSMCSVKKVGYKAGDGDIVTAELNLAQTPGGRNLSNVNFMMLKSSNFEPMTTIAKLDPLDGVTEVAQGKKVDGMGFVDGVQGGLLTPGALVDGDIDTNAGFYANAGTKGHIYIDLGVKYKIDRIDVLAYFDISTQNKNKKWFDRAGDFNLVLSNSVAKGEPVSDLSKKTVAYVPGATALTSAEAKYQSFFVTGENEFRYVSLEKFAGDIKGSDTLGLYIAEVKVYVKNEDMPRYVEVAQGKETGGWQDGNAAYHFSSKPGFPTANLVDDDETTGAGFYYSNNSPCKGYMYIDLGDEYKIDHIDIVAYDAIRPRNANGFNIIATNTLPDQIPYDSENPGTDLLLGTPPANNNSPKTAADGRTSYKMPENSGSYRYISFEQFSQTVNGYGLMIQDVKVYVREDDMPKYVEVAHGKVTGGRSTTNYCGTKPNGTFADVGKYPTALVDGNNDTYVGFYAGFGKTGNMYIDLGIPYKIDHIDILAYNEVYPQRAGDCDLIISNSVNNDAACTDENKLLVAHI